MGEPKFPNATIQLSQLVMSFFQSIIYAQKKILRREGSTPAQLDRFEREAISGNCMHTFIVFGEWCKKEEVVSMIGMALGVKFCIEYLIREKLRYAGASPGEISEFTKECDAGDYDHFIGVCKQWVHVE